MRCCEHRGTSLAIGEQRLEVQLGELVAPALPELGLCAGGDEHADASLLVEDPRVDHLQVRRLAAQGGAEPVDESALELVGVTPTTLRGSRRMRAFAVSRGTSLIAARK